MTVAEAVAPLAEEQRQKYLDARNNYITMSTGAHAAVLRNGGTNMWSDKTYNELLQGHRAAFIAAMRELHALGWHFDVAKEEFVRNDDTVS